MFYPKISDDTVLTFRMVQDHVSKAGPGWLDEPECPYSDTVKNYFRSLDAQRRGGEAVEDLFEGGLDDEPEVLDRQIQKILNRMDVMEKDIGGYEPNERLAFFKTRTALLEKLIQLREKVVNIGEMRAFQATVLKGLEDICTHDQIKQFMERLGK